MGTHYVGSQKEIRALNAYIKLLRSTQSLGDRIARHQAVPDLNGSQFGALEALYHLGPLPQKTIGEKLLISKSNVVAIIDALEERGFVIQSNTICNQFRELMIDCAGATLPIANKVIPGVLRLPSNNITVRAHYVDIIGPLPS